MIKARCKVSLRQSFLQLSIIRKILNLVPGASSFCVIKKEEALGAKL